MLTFISANIDSLTEHPNCHICARESVVTACASKKHRHTNLLMSKIAGITRVAERPHKYRSSILIRDNLNECGFQRLPPARGGTAQKKIIHLANWSQLIHPGPASSLTKVFLVSSKSCVNADSLLIRAAATSTSGTLNDLTTDLIMANNNNNNNNLNVDNVSERV